MDTRQQKSWADDFNEYIAAIQRLQRIEAEMMIEAEEMIEELERYEREGRQGSK